jgi:hypothetical protein
MSWQTYHSGHRANVEAAVEKRTEQLAKEKKQRAQDRRAKAVGAAEAAVAAGKGKQREVEPAAAPSVPFTAAEDEMLVSKAAGALVDGMLQSTVFTFLGIKVRPSPYTRRYHALMSVYDSTRTILRRTGRRDGTTTQPTLLPRSLPRSSVSPSRGRQSATQLPQGRGRSYPRRA